MNAMKTMTYVDWTVTVSIWLANTSASVILAFIFKVVLVSVSENLLLIG